MKKGQLRIWWLNGENDTEEVESLLEGLWLLHTNSMLEVNNELITCNAGGVEFYDEEFLKPDYECEDGFVSFYDDKGLSESGLMEYIYDVFGRENWSRISKENIREWLVENNVKGEIEEIKIV